MRLEQKASFSGVGTCTDRGEEVVQRVSDDRGGIVVPAAMLLPFLLLLVALTVDIGNWWVHKRHLQTQADAAALAGGGRFSECFANPAGADAVIRSEATKYAGSSGSTYNEQVGNANKGAITVLYQSKTFAVGGPSGRHRHRASVRQLRFRRQGNRG